MNLPWYNICGKIKIWKIAIKPKIKPEIPIIYIKISLEILGFSLNNSNAIYTAELLEESNNKIVINVKTPEAGVLVSKERYNTDWSVTVNGEKKELLNANLLFRGVYVDAGDNNIVFEFTPTMKYLYSTIICWIIFIVISILNIVLYFKKQDN